MDNEDRLIELENKTQDACQSSCFFNVEFYNEDSQIFDTKYLPDCREKFKIKEDSPLQVIATADE